MEILYAILAIVWSILCIILFFKVWGMTNDISEIKEYLLSKGDATMISVSSPTFDFSNAPSTTDPVIKEADSAGENLKVGDRVKHTVYNKDKILVIEKINHNGSCLCVDEKGNPVATYSMSKLEKIKD